MMDLLFYQSIRDFLLVYLPMQRVCSVNTITAYRRSINQFITYMAEKKGCVLSGIGFDDLTRENVISFLDDSQSRHKNSPATRNSKLYALRAFTKYAGTVSTERFSLFIELSTVPVGREEKRVVGYISEDAVRSVLRKPNTSTKLGIRDQCFMILMYDSAARDQEMLNLTLENLSLSGVAPYIRIVGKGNKMRHVPIMQKTVSHLQKYIRLFHPNPIGTDYLFYTVSHGTRHKMSDDNTARFIEKYGRMAQSECMDVPVKLTPHMFRHARALHLYRNGMPLPIISEFLGHSSIQSTQVYAYADTEMKRKAIEKAHGSSNLPNDTPIWQTDNDVIRKLYGL
jgi:site-specific recombinase XerD